MVGFARSSLIGSIAVSAAFGTGCSSSKEDTPFGFAQATGGVENAQGGSSGSPGGRSAGAGRAGQTGGTGGTAGSSQSGTSGADDGGEVGLPEPGPAVCENFVVTGDPTDAMGASWTYQSIDDGIAYALEGILFSPPGAGPFPAVLINHGKESSVNKYTRLTATTTVTWGLVSIGTSLTHATDADDAGNLPDGPDGASVENVERGRKTVDLLGCLGTVDMTRLATHGHSMGAFLNAELVGTYPGLFRAASHTAGGVSMGPNATKQEAAEQIVTPYSIHHGDLDMTVGIGQDDTLSSILEANGVDHEYHVYEGYDHPDIPNDETMYARVKAWYEAHGVLP